MKMSGHLFKGLFILGIVTVGLLPIGCKQRIEDKPKLAVYGRLEDLDGSNYLRGCCH